MYVFLCKVTIGRKVSDESLGRDETYVCKASHIIIYCQILPLFSNYCLHCLKSMAMSEPPLIQAQEFLNHISKDQERAKEVRIVVL